MVSKQTQWGKIRAYLNENGSATVRELFALGINSPTKRISELNDRGECITSMWCDGENREGERVRFKRYYKGGS